MQITQELFDKKRHNRSNFDCGVAKLNEFLSSRISQDIKKELCRAYVFHDEGEVVAYYTISPGQLNFSVLNTPYSTTPGYRIGWLAVDKKHQGKGLGQLVIQEAIKRCVSSSLLIGGKVAYLDAIDESAKAFYLKIGFSEVVESPNCLYFRLSDYKKVFPDIGDSFR